MTTAASLRRDLWEPGGATPPGHPTGIADAPDWRSCQVGRAIVKPSWLAAVAIRSS